MLAEVYTHNKEHHTIYHLTISQTKQPGSTPDFMVSTKYQVTRISFVSAAFLIILYYLSRTVRLKDKLIRLHQYCLFRKYRIQSTSTIDKKI